jgi:hypothetical protein
MLDVDMAMAILDFIHVEEGGQFSLRETQAQGRWDRLCVAYYESRSGREGVAS